MKIGFLGLLALIFITLKLCEVIAWSWWLVLLPLYGPLGLVILIFIAALVFATVSEPKIKKNPYT